MASIKMIQLTLSKILWIFISIYLMSCCQNYCHNKTLNISVSNTTLGSTLACSPKAGTIKLSEFVSAHLRSQCPLIIPFLFVSSPSFSISLSYLVVFLGLWLYSAAAYCNFTVSKHSSRCPSLYCCNFAFFADCRDPR